MSRLLRCPEVLAGLTIHLLLTVISTCTAYFLAPASAPFTAFICLLFTAVHLFITWRRYRRIARLSADLDRILHGAEEIRLDLMEEGELAILSSEIAKMTVRLREQQQTLLRDKKYLADSIADISHQIRTPLTAIHLQTELLAQDHLSDARRCQLCREQRDLLGRIDWLITALLKISRLDAGTVTFTPVSIPLADLLQQAASPLLIPIELRGQTLTIDAVGNFRGDLAWTCEAIGNIIKNCMEHTPTQGKIIIHAAENPIYSEITIHDSGNGISPDDLPHIFERFYKGKTSDDKSFGIGLALARMIITAQNGTIKAENHPHGGALFTIQFYKGTV